MSDGLRDIAALFERRETQGNRPKFAISDYETGI